MRVKHDEGKVGKRTEHGGGGPVRSLGTPTTPPPVTGGLSEADVRIEKKRIKIILSQSTLIGNLLTPVVGSHVSPATSR